MKRLTLRQRIDLPNVPVRDGGPPVFECLWCLHRFDMQKAYVPLYDSMQCPRCLAIYDPEGPHWVLTREGTRTFRIKHRKENHSSCRA